MTDREPVRICEYDQVWPSQFSELAARIRCALGTRVVRIEHIGSTAVPGLAAKPVIDLDVVVAHATVPEAIRCLGELGYAWEGDLGIRGREAFRWPVGEPRHHLYVLEEGAEELRRHIAFRDALRADATLRDRYAGLKRSLSIQQGSDRANCAKEKSDFVESVLCVFWAPSRQ